MTLAATVSTSALEFTLHDDGCGFDPAEATTRERANGGNGLPNLHARAAELRARLEISSAPDQGTTLRLTVPIP
ncbi:MAG: ATP-binding protein [Limisphaerales bacterium]